MGLALAAVGVVQTSLARKNVMEVLTAKCSKT